MRNMSFDMFFQNCESGLLWKEVRNNLEWVGQDWMIEGFEKYRRNRWMVLKLEFIFEVSELFFI